MEKQRGAEKAQSISSNEGVKENIRRELGYSDAEQSAAYAHGGTERFGRKGIISLIAAGLALVLCLCIVLPVVLLHRNPSAPGLIGGGTLNSIDTADEFYAYGAASVGSILSAGLSQESKSAQEARGAEVRSEAIEYTAEELGQEEYGYPYRMTVTVQDMLGGSAQYTMYYDKILTDSETDGDEKEEEYAISGILLVDGEQYPVRGEKETESEEGETELSLTFTAYRPSDASRKLPYLRMEQESEEETGEESEKFFLYTLYDENGEETQTTSVEYEQEEDGETELKITVERGNETDELRFWREEGKSNVLSARAKIGGKEYSFTVTVEEGNYRYEFSDGNSGGGDRPSHDDDDDDDDDD